MTKVFKRFLVIIAVLALTLTLTGCGFASKAEKLAEELEQVKLIKQKELQDIEVRIQEYQQSAQVDMQNKQQEIFAPIQMKANEAVQKVGRTNGLVYIFDISMGTIPFVNETLSIDVTPMVKAELNISPSKKLPAPQGM